VRSLELPEPFTFFVDRCLGDEIIPNTLSASGFQVEPHSKHFVDTTPDAEWLEAVGKRG
jgi:hypothetical protein